jgi:IS1 family transposase
MNKLSREKRTQIIAALVEGNSIRATCRMTDSSKGAVTKLLVELGEACAEFQDKALRNLSCKRLQADEIWSFVGKKQKQVKETDGPGLGDMWTWVAIDADTKLVPCWLVGKRDAGYAFQFISDLASRLSNRVQLTTDGHKTYLTAVEDTFGTEIDYAMLVKLYGSVPEGDTRYSPPECVYVRREIINGSPDVTKISTSYVERQNLTMRMSMRRFTRLTNAFSKKLDNLKHSVAIHFMHYNFCRISQNPESDTGNGSGSF